MMAEPSISISACPTVPFGPSILMRCKAPNTTVTLKEGRHNTVRVKSFMTNGETGKWNTFIPGDQDFSAQTSDASPRGGRGVKSSFPNSACSASLRSSRADSCGEMIPHGDKSFPVLSTQRYQLDLQRRLISVG
jgi:hypothetical protein